MTPAELAAVIHCYPTQVEAIQRIADQARTWVVGAGVPMARSAACVGVIDMRAQAEVPSARRSDTPTLLALSM
jgi:hypothetical protein